MKNNILYKYSSLENAKKILEDKTLKLTNPNDFNDPFDCHVPTIEYDFNRISKRVKKIFSKDQDRKISQKNWMKEFSELNTLKQELLGLFENLKKDWNKYVGYYRILSLTGNPNNILMWSHYADSHNGVVLGFNFIDSKIHPSIKQVKYNNNEDNTETKKFLDEIFIDIFNELAIDINTEYNEDKFVSKLMLHLHLYFFMKDDEWNYEDEYRLVLKSEKSENHFLNFNDMALKEIIFGIKVSEEKREEFLNNFDYLDDCNIFTTEEKNNKLNVVPYSQAPAW